MIGDRLIATTDGSRVFVLSASSHASIAAFEAHSSPVRAVTAIAGSLVATGDRKGTVHIWDVSTRESVSVEQFNERVIELAYDGARGKVYVITEAEVAAFAVQLAQQTTAPTDEARLRNPVGAVPPERLEAKPPKAQRRAKNNAKSLRDVEVTRTGRPFELQRHEDELIRTFSMVQKGVRCDVSLLGGGLSGARVFRLKVFDRRGGTRVSAVAKIGKREDIVAESRNYDGEVARLAPGATPRRLDTIERRQDGTAAVFYSLAAGFDRPAFQLAADDLAVAVKVVSNLIELTTPWWSGAAEERLFIGDLRRARVPDRHFEPLIAAYDLGWAAEIEKIPVQVRRCTLHGDLHGGNVLVDETGNANIIDYGDVVTGPASFDPVTFELSHLFHPDSPINRDAWPSAEQAKAWRRDEYLNGSPVAELVRACWRWSDRVAAGRREIGAAAYAYLVKQLTYDDTSKQRALALLEGARSVVRDT